MYVCIYSRIIQNLTIFFLWKQKCPVPLLFPPNFFCVLSPATLSSSLYHWHFVNFTRALTAPPPSWIRVPVHEKLSSSLLRLLACCSFVMRQCWQGLPRDRSPRVCRWGGWAAGRCSSGGTPPAAPGSGTWFDPRPAKRRSAPRASAAIKDALKKNLKNFEFSMLSISCSL